MRAAPPDPSRLIPASCSGLHTQQGHNEHAQKEGKKKKRNESPQVGGILVPILGLGERTEQGDQCGCSSHELSRQSTVCVVHWTGEQRGKPLPFPLQGEYGGTGPVNHGRWGGQGRRGWGGCSSGVLRLLQGRQETQRGDRALAGE